MSEKTLDSLIATLKTEAIEGAEKESDAILKAAQNEAKRIVEEAEEKQKQILSNAQKEADATLSKGESALRQAARDVTVSLQNDLIQLLKAVLERDVATNFTPDVLGAAVVKVIENIGDEVALELSPDLEVKLADYIQQRLQKSDTLAGITTNSTLSKSLNITKKDQGWNYHISPEAVTELLGIHLSDKWMKILKSEIEK
ncbi:hypothetical protein LV716_01530 [Flagellimonas sp. HMM57]|uniref:hypothetical protein n=1 Tax=unclassified Flagellimonas TaxID=2644544 RepID=UPI0013D2E4EB|nr:MULTISPECIES: hypothetical protein [unclassified Flagellimonas]UII76496.1 hypothetical protein LV716_01530 [Flagellimonas sp. HMM57]